MPIEMKKKPVELEFEYEPGENSDGVGYTVKFYYENDAPILSFHAPGLGQKKEIILCVTTMAEIIDFLREQGVIEIVEKEQKKGELSSETTIKIPQIHKKEENEDEKQEQVGVSNRDIIASKIDEGVVTGQQPITSFNIPEANEQPIIVSSKENTVEKVVVSEKKDDIIIDRPVIRTQSDENDPLSAEKQASSMRKKNPAKTIKRRER